MDDIQKECELFGWFGLFIQLMLGLLSFAVLVYKRFKEHPKRPWRIWFLDTSKQAVSQLLAHFLNVAISLKLSVKQANDPCLWYFATIILDCTVGMLICVGILRLFEVTLFKGSRAKYQSGNYYEIIQVDESLVMHGEGVIDPEAKMLPLQVTERRNKIMQSPGRFRINYLTWLVQFIIWNCIVVAMKSMLFAIQDLLSQPIMDVTEFLMGWITSYPKLELTVVMFIIPVCMNALAFWIQDNYLMKKAPKASLPHEQHLLQDNQVENRKINELL